MKLDRLLSRLIPSGIIREEAKNLYYSLYYNSKHFKENGFRVYYNRGVFKYIFTNGIHFYSHSNIEEELRLSLWGYIKKHSLKEGEVVVDCGADVGDFTLYAAKAVGESGRVVAFEPDPALYEKLLSNISLNRLTNVIPVKKGVWSANTTLKFMCAKDAPRTVFVGANTSGCIEIPVVSLDHELKNVGVKKVDFIKIDVEGAELEVIKGAQYILKTNSVNLAVASYHVCDGEKTYVGLEKLFPALGYSAETAYPKHLTTYAHKNILSD